jgi:TonB family protein
MTLKHTILLLLLSFSVVTWAKKEDPVKQRIEQDAGLFELDEVTQRPEFPKGGVTAMYKFLAENVHYPESMYESGISGRVGASFIVEQDGTLSDIQITQSMGDAFDEEVIRVLGKMPRWTPAKIYYKDRMLRVRTRNQISVEFKATQK